MNLNDVIEDFKNGENIDVYITSILSILLAIINVILSICNIKIDYIIAPLNLTALFFITIILLNNRKKLEIVNKNIANMNKKNDIMELFPLDYKDNIENGNEIYIIGIHHNSNLTAYYPSYRKFLENKGKLKILLVDPIGEAIKMAAKRFPEGFDPEQEKSRAKSSIKTLEKLKEEFNNVEVKTLDYLFEYSALLIDPSKLDSVVYIERYTFKIYGGANKPKFVYTKNDGKWYNLFENEIKFFWEEGKYYKF